MTAEMLLKNDMVIEGGLRSLEICKRAGVPVAFGTDLLGQLQADQSREFLLAPARCCPPLEIVRQATTVGGAGCCAGRAGWASLRPGAQRRPAWSWTATPCRTSRC